MLNSTTSYPQFFTATILEWKHLLKTDAHKMIIVESLKYLVKEKRVVVYGYVIMENHIHLIWQMVNENKRDEVQHSFLSYTAKQLKKALEKDDSEFLEEFRVDAKDRIYQIWERNALSIDLFTPAVFDQKLDYIHYNPVKAGLCNFPEEYGFSSARFYYDGTDLFNFIVHYADG
jgi:REP element-mobilizing transposase RayT